VKLKREEKSGIIRRKICKHNRYANFCEVLLLHTRPQQQKINHFYLFSKEDMKKPQKAVVSFHPREPPSCIA
jgi:hypothetical protein